VIVTKDYDGRSIYGVGPKQSGVAYTIVLNKAHDSEDCTYVLFYPTRLNANGKRCWKDNEQLYSERDYRWIERIVIAYQQGEQRAREDAEGWTSDANVAKLKA
jgi:hypothetical protein